MADKVVFAEIARTIRVQPSIAESINGVYQFVIKDGDKTSEWTVDLKASKDHVKPGRASQADVTISIPMKDFVSLVAGELNPQKAFMQGSLKIVGNMGMALKMGQLFRMKTEGAEAAGGDTISFIFREIESNIKSDEGITKRINGIYKFHVKPEKGEDQSWIVDLRQGKGEVRQLSGKDEKADVTFSFKESDFIDMMGGRIDGQTAFMQGKMRIKGNMAMALKLNALVASKIPKSKL